jgi:hypothetical protein
MRSLDRREFLKLMGVAGISTLMPWPARLAEAQSASYDGPFFVSIAAEGGWDVTAFCDPKENVGGEPIINHWAETGETQTIAGSAIRYAPFANNQEFFERFHTDMLIVNGIDTETNSHDSGTRHSWSGRIAPGYPSLAAIAASVYGPDLPLAFISNGVYRDTAGLVVPTLVQKPIDLKALVLPNRTRGGGSSYHPEEELAIVEAYQQQRIDAQMAAPGILPRHSANMQQLLDARLNREMLALLADRLPEDLVDQFDKDGYKNKLLQQAQLALICYDAGLTVSCDLNLGGFDSHKQNDLDQTEGLSKLTNGIAYLYDTAEAMGIADKLVVLVSSDFGRKPFYNNDDGKDHWPVGSAMIIQQGASWGGRVVGATDEGHNPLTIDPSTLALDDSESAIRIRPGHLHNAMRRLAGVDEHPSATAFPLDAEQLDLFS